MSKPNPWTAEQVAKLRSLWPDRSLNLKTIGKLCGHPAKGSAQYYGIEVLGLPRLTRGRHAGQDYAPQSGDAPGNKRRGPLAERTSERPIIAPLHVVAAAAAALSVPFRGWDDLWKLNAELDRKAKPRYAKPLPFHQQQRRAA